MAGRSLVALGDLSTTEILQILDVADGMADAVGFDDPSKRTPSEPLDRILAALFFEPSTRTRLSFESAMLRLGGQVIGFADPSGSSVSKGESLADTVRMAAGYSDIIVIRHPLAGSAKVAADFSSVPVINAGDGPHEHPTQTLTDLFCIRRAQGKLDGLKVGLCGDLKYGRTVHSLAPMMARFGSEIVCIAPDELQLPERWMSECQAISGRRPAQVASLEEAISGLDVLYMTRIQRERFDRPEDYERVKNVYILTPEIMKRGPEGMIVLHPLPRVNEITPAVDADPRALYFKQAAGGVPVRMALISLLLGMSGSRTSRGQFGLGGGSNSAGSCDATQAATEPRKPAPKLVTGPRCANPKCITTQEPLEPLFYDEPGALRCVYCEETSVQRTL
ncbi:MAG: aspartate carbamoyltransferase [Armatimonadetes bacterium]|nr:aspartate carbamoyltransferase [Armatimonadota bacterium]